MPRKCTLCRASFVNELALEAHVETAHSSAYPCPRNGCKKAFATRTAREEHVADAHTSASLGQGHRLQPPGQRPAPIHQPFVANPSPAQYRGGTNRSGPPQNGYSQGASPDASSPLRNTPTNSSPQRISARLSSNPTVTSQNSDMWHCGMCERTFAEKFDLNQHMTVHVGTTQFHQCERCKAFFPNTESLNQHRQSPADCSRSGKQWHKCIECNKLFENASDFQNHKQAVHKPSNPTLESKIHPITVKLPPTIQHQIQQMHRNAPIRPAQSFPRVPGSQAHPAPQNTAPFNATTRPIAAKHIQTPSVQAPHKVYPVPVLLATRPVIAPAPPRPIPALVQRPSAHAPSRHPAPALAPRRPGGTTVQGPSLSESKRFERSTQQPQEISSRVTDLQLHDRPRYNATGEVLYNEQIWTGVAFEKHEDALNALYWRCHLTSELRKTGRIPRAFDDTLSSHSEEDLAFEFSPAPSDKILKHRAVVLASHKVVVEGGKQEIVLLSVLNFFTGEVLLHHLVLPESPVENWRTRITGFKENSISDALKAGHAVLNGWKAARQAVWLLIDANTVLVGYGLRETLDALRMSHGCGVDGAILIQEAAGGSLSKKDLRLENLSRDFLGHELKADNENGRDCLENVFAARELVLWIWKNKEKLVVWGKAKLAGCKDETELIKLAKKELAVKLNQHQEPLE